MHAVHDHSHAAAYRWFTGEGWGDALVSALAIVAVSMCCLVVIALGFIPATRKFLYGEEGSRVRDARLNARNHSTGSIPVSESDALSVP